MNFCSSLIYSAIVSSLIVYAPWLIYTKGSSNSLIYPQIRASIDKIPLRNDTFNNKRLDLNHITMSWKEPIVLNENYKISDSKFVKKTPVIVSKVDISEKKKILNTEPKNYQPAKSVNFHLVNKLKNEEVPKQNYNNNTSKTKIIDTINQAFLYNPKIKAQQAAFNSSKENIKQVKSNYLPSIDFTASQGYKQVDSNTTTTSTNEERNPQDYSINITQDLFSGGKLSAEINKAKSQLMIEGENLKQVKQEIILDAATVYLEILQQNKLIEINELKEERLKQDLIAMELLHKVGSASQSDLVFVKSELVKTSATKIASLNEIQFIKEKYKTIVGKYIGNSSLKEPNLNNIKLPESFETAFSIALEKNPEYKKSKIREQISKYEVKSQFSEALPRLTLDAEYSSSDDFTSKGSSSESSEITAELTVPLFRGGKNLSKIKQAKLIAKKVRYDLENRKNETIQEVKNAWSKYKSSEVNLKSANISYEANKLILEGIEQEAKLGMRSYIDVLISKENLIDAEFEKIKANNQLMFSALQLKANIGELSLKNLDI